MTYHSLPYSEKEQLDSFIQDYFRSRLPYDTNEDKDKFWATFVNAVEAMEGMDEYEFGYFNRRDNQMPWLFDEATGENKKRQDAIDAEHQKEKERKERAKQVWRRGKRIK